MLTPRAPRVSLAQRGPAVILPSYLVFGRSGLIGAIFQTPKFKSEEAAIAKRSFATLGTTSPANRPHAAGVLYAHVDGVLYVSTLRSSRKARNIAANPHVFVSVPVRRVPFGAPPSTVQFAATAEVLAVDDPDVLALARAGQLKAITGHGGDELPQLCAARFDRAP